MSIDINEIVKQLESKKSNIEGQSSVDIGRELCKTKENVRCFIRQAMEAGLCDFVGNKESKSINGKTYKVPVYRFKMKKK